MLCNVHTMLSKHAHRNKEVLGYAPNTSNCQENLLVSKLIWSSGNGAFQLLHFVMVCVQFRIIIASGQREWKRMSIQCPVPSLCSGYQYSTTVLCAMGWSPGGNFSISFSFYRHCSYLLVLENWKSSNRRVWNLWYFSIAFYLFYKSYKRLHQ